LDTTPRNFPIDYPDHTIPSNGDVDTTEVAMREDRHWPRPHRNGRMGGNESHCEGFGNLHKFAILDT
jgi:hypothetical protein